MWIEQFSVYRRRLVVVVVDLVEHFFAFCGAVVTLVSFK